MINFYDVTKKKHKRNYLKLTFKQETLEIWEDNVTNIILSINFFITNYSVQ